MTASPQWPGTLGLSAADVARALGLPPPTPEQAAVIEAPPGPALVVAGAGSGKTETMSGRVVWLVANAHVRRDEILGLTFTRKAAGELAERMSERLSRVDEFARRGLLPHLAALVAEGVLDDIATLTSRERHALLDSCAARYPQRTAAPDADDLMLRPRVSTYNAFADAIVREHAARIGQDPDAAMLAPSASWLLARSVVLASTDPVLAEREDYIDTVVSAVLSLAGESLDHRADLGEVAEFGARVAADLEPFTNAALQSPQPPERAWSAVAGLPLVARLAEQYAVAKREQGVREFADQVSGALEIVGRSPDVVRDYQEQYRVVLLDEYQDTSVIQTELLSALFRDGSVMAVGDPNQAIYGWRGASADNLPAFPRAFASDAQAARFDLSTSWRNDEQILVAANAVLAAAPEPPPLAVPELQPRPNAGAGVVECRYEISLDREADTVADWFAAQRAVQEDPTQHSGAILFRSKKHMQTFADALDRRDIPHRILGLGGLLSTPEVTDVIAALRVISDPHAGSSLLRLLAGPRFGMGVADLAALRELASTLSRRDTALQPLDAELLARIRGSAGLDEQLSIIDALEFVRTAQEGYRLTAGFTDEGRQRLREAAEVFARLRHTTSASVIEVIRHIEAELRLDIELAANESRGPARVAATQLRAFGDEVRAFLDSSQHGTIGALLAWLDHASDSDELMPRPEPPEPGVVQLLTIHGSKGLEWDAVAVVRLVADELPKAPRSRSGWLSFGRLPYPFRGDRNALPEFAWTPAPDEDRKSLGVALAEFSAGVGAYLAAEERRLAYVAVTRARTDLLVTGSWWGGQTKPRGPSSYLVDMLDALGAEPIADLDPDIDNPYAETDRTLQWPLDALGARRATVQRAAELVRAAQEHTPRVANDDLRALLAERAERQLGVVAEAPTRVPASRFKDYVTDYSGTVASVVRRMPERPYRQTRLGTLFHAWVEQRSGVLGASAGLDDELWERDDDDHGGAAPGDEQELARLRDIFTRSEWAPLRPIAVELEIDFAFGDADDDAHIVICKLDAVYERAGGRIEIVDWKTGRPPQYASERDERMLQLALYRLAYHRRFGTPLSEIDVALYYVADDLVIRSDQVYSEAELVQRWRAARAAR